MLYLLICQATLQARFNIAHGYCFVSVYILFPYDQLSTVKIVHDELCVQPLVAEHFFIQNSTGDFTSVCNVVHRKLCYIRDDDGI